MSTQQISLIRRVREALSSLVLRDHAPHWFETKADAALSAFERAAGEGEPS